jgi:hypothetical protein
MRIAVNFLESCDDPPDIDAKNPPAFSDWRA